MKKEHLQLLNSVVPSEYKFSDDGGRWAICEKDGIYIGAAAVTPVERPDEIGIIISVSPDVRTLFVISLLERAYRCAFLVPEMIAYFKKD